MFLLAGLVAVVVRCLECRWTGGDVPNVSCATLCDALKVQKERTLDPYAVKSKEVFGRPRKRGQPRKGDPS